MMTTNDELQAQLDALRTQLHAHETNMIRLFRIMNDTAALTVVARTLSETTSRLEDLMATIREAITELHAEVEKARTVRAGAIALLDQLLTLVEENVGNPAELQEIVSTFRTDTDAFAGEIEARTPAAEPEPEPEPGEPGEPEPEE